jgi:hypothetical protein
MRHKTRKRYLINPLTVRAAIKKNPLLSGYIGQWCASSRVSGWGHTYGYIQVESTLIECNPISRNEYVDICENVYSTKVELYCEQKHSKEGWTDKHAEDLQKILNTFKIKLEVRN